MSTASDLLGVTNSARRYAGASMTWNRKLWPSEKTAARAFLSRRLRCREGTVCHLGEPREYNEAPSVSGIGNFFLAAAAIHPGRYRATPTTPFEIDGATQVWHSSARYAQFRAPAFPSSLPCRSRCRALAGLVRAQTSDDIRPRALCTPPPKSFTRSPRTLHRAHAATGIPVWSAPFTPRVHFGADSDLCATAYLAGAAGPYSMRRATERDRRC